MANRRLREIIVNLNSRLSNDDRERLHFYLKDDVRRTLADDSSFIGTFHLMQELFEQDKMNENDFTFLIDTFQKIRCFDAVKLLKEHERRMHLSGCSQSTVSLASMMPALIDEVLSDDHVEDKHPTKSLFDEYIELERKKNYFKSNTTLNGIAENNDTISHRIQLDDETQSLLPRPKSVFWKSSCVKKRFFFLYILLALLSTAFVVIEVKNIQRIHYFEAYFQSKNLSMGIDQQPESNINTVIAQLNKTIFIQFEKQRKLSYAKIGHIFGSHPNGMNFDDSTLPSFTSNHYLSGLIISNLSRFDSCRFIYRSSKNNQSRIESPIHGNWKRPISSPYEYYLDDHERIEKVLIQTTDEPLVNEDQIYYGIKRVNKFQFITTADRQIPLGVDFNGGNITTERFEGYFLGHVVGAAYLVIDELQFVWYRKTTM